MTNPSRKICHEASVELGVSAIYEKGLFLKLVHSTIVKIPKRRGITIRKGAMVGTRNTRTLGGGRRFGGCELRSVDWSERGTGGQRPSVREDGWRDEKI